MSDQDKFQRYIFYPIESQLVDNDWINYFNKWGVQIQVKSFRYNLEYQSYNQNLFLKNLFQTKFGGKYSYEHIDTIKEEKLKCSLINFNFIDYFYKNKLLNENGDVKLCLPQYVNGKEYQNLIQQFFVKEELIEMCYDIPEILENLNTEEFQYYKDEFLIELFKEFILGGKYCQFEENIEKYREITKQFYKKLVTQYKKNQKR